LKKHFLLKSPIFSLLIILFLAAGAALAAPVGRVTHLEGRVDVLKAGQTVARPVSPGQSVDVGDTFRTKSRSKAEVTFLNKNILRIAASTRVTIQKYMVRGDDNVELMNLHRGMVQVVSSMMFIKRLIASSEKNKLEIKTANAVCGVRGSNMIVSYHGGVTSVLFITGKGYAYNPAKPEIVVPITAGNISFIEKKDATPTQPRPLSEVEMNVIVKSVSPDIESGNDAKQGTSSSVSSTTSGLSSTPSIQSSTTSGISNTASTQTQSNSTSGISNTVSTQTQSNLTSGISVTSPGQSGTSPGLSGTTPGLSGTSPGQSGTTPGLSGTAPGLSGTTPGLGGMSPGQSGTSPGLSGTTPGLSGTSPGQSGTTPGLSGTTPGQSGTSHGHVHH